MKCWRFKKHVVGILVLRVLAFVPPQVYLDLSINTYVLKIYLLRLICLDLD